MQKSDEQDTRNLPSILVGRRSTGAMPRRTDTAGRPEERSARRSAGAGRDEEEVATLHHVQGRQRRGARDRGAQVPRVLVSDGRGRGRRFRGGDESGDAEVGEWRGRGLLCHLMINIILLVRDELAWLYFERGAKRRMRNGIFCGVGAGWQAFAAILNLLNINLRICSHPRLCSARARCYLLCDKLSMFRNGCAVPAERDQDSPEVNSEFQSYIYISTRPVMFRCGAAEERKP